MVDNIARSVILSIILIFACDITFGQSMERYKTLPDTMINSDFLSFEKNISITIPKELQSTDKSQRFPLIIVFDSQNKRSYNYILNTIDYLTSNEQMPASIIMGVESSQNRRYIETQFEISDEAGRGSYTESFVFDELIPLAKTGYKASDFVMLIGHSRYGYFSTYLICKRPTELNAVISISPFFKQKNINLIDSVAKIFSNRMIEHHLYYRFGIGNDFPEDFEAMQNKLTQMKNTNELLSFEGKLFSEAIHNVTPGITIGTALYEIFEFWSKQQNAYLSDKTTNLDTIKVLNECIKNHYGSSIPLSLGTLNGKGWSCYNQNNYEQAIRAWELLLELYPSFSEGYLSIAYAQQELKEDYANTLQKFKENIATSEFYTKSEKLDLLEECKELEK